MAERNEKLIHKMHYVFDADGSFIEHKYNVYRNDIAKYHTRLWHDVAVDLLG